MSTRWRFVSIPMSAGDGTPLINRSILPPAMTSTVESAQLDAMMRPSASTSTPSHWPAPLASTVGAASPGFQAKIAGPPNATTMNRAFAASQAMPLGPSSVPPASGDELQRLDRPVRPDAADEAVVVLGHGVPVDVGDEIEVELGVVLDGLRRLEPLDRQHPGSGGGRGLLRPAAAGEREGGEPEREDTARLDAQRGTVDHGTVSSWVGTACDAAGEAPTYPGNLDPGSPVMPAGPEEGEGGHGSEAVLDDVAPRHRARGGPLCRHPHRGPHHQQPRGQGPTRLQPQFRWTGCPGACGASGPR